MKFADCLARSRQVGELLYASPGWSQTAATYVERFVDFAGDLPLDQYGPHHLAEWAAHLHVRGDSRQTIKNKLGAIRGRLKEAATWGWIDAVPHGPPLRGKPRVRQRILGDGEEPRLLAVLQHHQPHGLQAAEITAVLVDLGCRLGSLWGLRHHDVDYVHRTVYFHVVKNKTPYRVGATRRALIILQRWAGPPPITIRTYQRTFKIGRDALGLENEEEFVPHMLRHTCASRMLAKNVSLKQIQKHLGHTTLAMTLNYIKLLTGQLVEAAEALEDY